jgi:hypothetical protein
MIQTKKIIDGLSNLDLYFSNEGSHYRLYADKPLNCNSNEIFSKAVIKTLSLKHESILF